MCGRLMLEEDVTEIPRHFNLHFFDLESWSTFKHKDDTPPGVNIPVVYPDRIQPTLWGWWFWQKNKVGKEVKRLVINTRQDTVLEKLQMKDKKYTDIVDHHRVLIPCNGFYEWPGKQKTLFTKADEHLFALGGLVFPSKTEDGKKVQCVSILTVEPNEQMSLYHDRMPMYVPENRYKEWLSGTNIDVESFFTPRVEYQVQLVG